MKAIVLRVGRSLLAVLRVDVFLISSILAARIDYRHWLLIDADRLLQKKLKRYR